MMRTALAIAPVLFIACTSSRQLREPPSQASREATRAPPRGDGETFVYVGGADWSGRAFPFRSFRLDRASGSLTPLQAAVDLGLNPSYVTPDASGRLLYVANEDERAPGVTVARVDAATGHVEKLARRSLPGRGALVFTSLDPSGRYVFAADHNGGRALVYPVEPDGMLAAASDTQQFDGAAHTHSVRTDPSGRFAYVPNKDAHHVAQFAFDARTGKLSPLRPAVVAAPGGPRHIAFTPEGRFAVVMMEYDDKVNSYAVGADGALTQVDSQSSLPAGFAGDDNTGAHVLVHPRGKFVYASNRGHDSIAVFAIAASGQLTLLEHVKTLGKTPRNFAIDPSGQLLVVANQGEVGADSGSLVVFAIGEDGKLTQRGAPLAGLRSPNAVAIVSLQGSRATH